MSDATQSRRRITVGVDDTVQGFRGNLISYCYSWYSGRFHQVLKGQNILAVTLKVGDIVIPLCVRLVSKQGRANTSKPTLLIEMMNEIAAFFQKRGIAMVNPAGESIKNPQSNDTGDFFLRHLVVISVKIPVNIEVNLTSSRNRIFETINASFGWNLNLKFNNLEN